MSSFLSTKYLRYRGLIGQKPKPIEGDLSCTTCGYNLRGLKYGGRCPECGAVIALDAGAVDRLLSGDLDGRWRVMAGLTLVAGCCLALVAGRVLFSAVSALSVTPPPLETYIGFAGAVSVAWFVGVWLTTDQNLKSPRRGRAWMRHVGRWSQFLWIPSLACWYIVEAGVISGPTDTLEGWAVACDLAARLGFLVFGCWLLGLADDAGLEDAVRAISFSLLMIAILSAILMIVDLQLPWIIFIISLVVLVPWARFGLLFFGGIMQLRSHVQWSIRLSQEGGDRMARIDRTRRDLDAQVNATVRPLPEPGGSDDLPLAGRQS